MMSRCALSGKEAGAGVWEAVSSSGLEYRFSVLLSSVMFAGLCRTRWASIRFRAFGGGPQRWLLLPAFSTAPGASDFSDSSCFRRWWISRSACSSASQTDPAVRKRLVSVSLAVNLGLLGIVKFSISLLVLRPVR